jgi:hypothetical protein
MFLGYELWHNLCKIMFIALLGKEYNCTPVQNFSFYLLVYVGTFSPTSYCSFAIVRIYVNIGISISKNKNIWWQRMRLCIVKCVQPENESMLVETYSCLM